MTYVKVANGQVVQVGLPEVGHLADGRSVSSFNLLPADILKEAGWLPIEFDNPEYDPVTHTVQFEQYIIEADRVVSKSIAVEKVEEIPIEPEPTTEEVLNGLIATLVDKGVIY